ncbi:CHRD domain-containing protein [Pseudonocardia oroxyli]|uniref:CHRD domain-containing protein n=1 Tax=Pseudonocardia oroxyli TaxID=366584 RepID=A0A1G7G8U3_PSEOR|nr:CHRD domain-containing protein [Pseudonocardia oroxyli]SDE84550.1 CHRD domain-containing protein [Pseudonocardia oroxyli]
MTSVLHRTLRAATVAAVVAGLAAFGAGTASAQDGEVAEPAEFTSMFTAMATPDMVVNNDGVATPGEPGATGTFHYRLNSELEVICYDITLDGVTPPYQSPARTATHIHEGDAGSAGPPRIAFPNPEDAGDGTLRSAGCLQGPFTTGVMANGQDTGTGFTLDRIEADPAAFFTDTHTATFTAGAVRGQLTEVPMGGVATGAGGAATETDTGTAAIALGAGAVLAAGAGGAVWLRRRASA